MSKKITKYNTKTVANAIILSLYKAGKRNQHPMKIQKLLYIFHAWSLVFFKKSFLKERPKSYPHGPMFETLFAEQKGMGAGEFFKELCYPSGELKPLMPSHDDVDFWDTVNQVVYQHKDFDELQLAALCNREASPWDKSRKMQLLFIPDEYLITHYGKLLEESKTQKAVQ